MKLEDWIIKEVIPQSRIIRHGRDRGETNSVTIGIPYGPWIANSPSHLATSKFSDYKFSSMRDGYYWFLRVEEKKEKESKEERKLHDK